MTETSSYPLARRIRSADLYGLSRNQIEVPPGQQAIVILPAGAAQTLSTGRHKVPGAKWFGTPPPMALVPAGEFNLLCGVPRLGAGDKQNVDASFAVTLHVGDGGRFIGRMLNEAETLGEQDFIARLTALAQPILAGLIQAYTAIDLCGPTPVAGRLEGELRARLTAALNDLGLQLKGVRYLMFTPAQTVKEETDAIQQLQASVAAGDDVTAQVAQVGLPPDAAQDRSQLAQLLDQKLVSVAGQIIGRLEARLQAQHVVMHKTLQSERWERMAKVFQLFAALFLLATVLLRLVVPIEEGPIRRISEVFSALATLATAVAWFYARSQARRQRFVEIKPTPLLNRVSRDDRQLADRLVREQLANELTQIARTLKSAREKVYTQGHEDTALTLGDTLREVERLQKDVATPSAGTPPYLTKPRITLDELETMLDYDEDLLREANALDEAAQAVLQSTVKGEAVATPATAVRGELAQLQYRFAARARFLQSTGVDSRQ